MEELFTKVALTAGMVVGAMAVLVVTYGRTFLNYFLAQDLEKSEPAGEPA